jgi:hypothetical protein
MEELTLDQILSFLDIFPALGTSDLFAHFEKTFFPEDDPNF